jgi:hypothetical protein
MEAIWATTCGLSLSPAAPGTAGAGLHCSNTYFAGTTSVMTRFILLGSYEVLNDPR